MTDELDALLAAVHDNPQDTLPRLVFADWLDDRGEVEYAELIRCGSQVADSARCQMLETALSCRWGLEPDEHSLLWSPDRTILADRVRIRSELLIRNHRRWPSYFRPRKLTIKRCHGHESELLANPHVVRAVELLFEDIPLSLVSYESIHDPLLDALSRFSGPRPRVLEFPGATVSFAALSRFATSAVVEKLERLTFGLPRRLYPDAGDDVHRVMHVLSPGDGRLTHALEVIANRYPGFAPPP
jgi:uncharacterized protein (TIGR02996 family)